jgi:uridine kinase
MKPFLIGLTGLSGAGKSTLADHLEAQGGIKRFRFDSYFKTEADCPKLDNGKPHWDLPESLYLDEVYEALSELSAGNDIFLPLYNRRLSDRTGRVLFKSAPVIFAEGLQLFSEETIRELFDLRLFLDVDEATATARRLERQPEYDLSYHEAIAIPAARKHVLPMKVHAHEVIDGGRSVREVTQNADRVIQRFLGV